eukprot:gene3592-6186_t
MGIVQREDNPPSTRCAKKIKSICATKVCVVDDMLTDEQLLNVLVFPVHNEIPSGSSDVVEILRVNTANGRSTVVYTAILNK